MNRAEAEKLLGGYATGTLTEAERKLLFEAALAGQDLFDALADEEALRELLSDARARRRLLDALAEPEATLLGRFLGWWRRPVAWGVAGSVAVAALLVAILVPVYRTMVQKPAAEQLAEAPVEMAKKMEPAAPPAAVPLAPVPRQRRAVEAVAKAPSEEPAPVMAAPPPPPAQVEAPEKEVVAVRGPAPVEAPEQEVAAARAPARGGVVGGAIGGVVVEADARNLYYASVAELKDVAQTAFQAERAKRTARAEVSGLRQAAPPSGVPGMRYAILKLGPDGRYTEVDPETVFARGDTIRLSVEANQAGSLELLRQDAAGAWSAVEKVGVEARARQVLPSEGGLSVDGPEKLRLVFTRQPEGWAAPAGKALVEKAADERAVYVVEPGASTLRAEISVTVR